MAGIQKGSSDNLTSPIPHLLNADFLTAAARLAPGQVHYAGRDYYQRDTDIHYRLKALAKCFLADGTTPATMPGTWGTLEAHWVVASASGAVPTNGLNGNRVLALAAIPALSDGNLGDLAIVTTTGELYEKTASGWVLRGTLGGGGAGSGTVTGIDITQWNTTDKVAVFNDANWNAFGYYTPGPLLGTGEFHQLIKLPTATAYGYAYRTISNSIGDIIVYRTRLT